MCGYQKARQAKQMPTKPPGKVNYKAPIIGAMKGKSFLSSYGFPVIMALVAAVILAGGYLLYHFQEQQTRQRTESGLSIVAESKADQISEWRAARLVDANTLAGSPSFTDTVAAYIATPTDNEARDKVIGDLAIVAQSYPYQDILLTDIDGNVLLSVNNSVRRLSDMALTQLPLAIKEHQAVFTDFHYPPDSNSPHLNVIAPIFPRRQDSPTALGAVVLYIDPSRYLYPLVQSFPMSSQTGEALLVERDGDQVLFLNELRHQQDTALKLRIPLSREDVPAVMAVLGKEGVFEGKDYRGIPVLAALQPIPDSPWYLVAKMDTSEALATWRPRSGFIIASVAGVMAAALAIIGLVWQRRQRQVYQKLYEAEARRKKLEKNLIDSETKYRRLFETAQDSILILDGDTGRIIDANPFIKEMLGYTLEELRGKHLWEVGTFKDIVASKDAFKKLKKKGYIRYDHLPLQNKDGRQIHVEFVSNRYTVDHREVFQCNIRNITERKQAENALRESEERYRALFDRSLDCVYLHDLQGNFLDANDKALKLLGYNRKDIPHLNFASLLSEDQLPGAVAALEEVKETGTQRQPHEFKLKRKDGRYVYVETTESAIYRDGNIYAIQGIARDLTERKQAEQSLRDSEQRYRALVQQSLVGIGMSRENKIIFANTALLNIWGYDDLDEFASKSLLDHVTPSSRERIADRMKKVAQGKTLAADFELDILRKDGEIRTLNATSSWVKLGGETYTQTVFQDVTERKQVEVALQQSEEKYRSLVEHSPDIVWSFSSRSGTIYVSSRVEPILGYTPAYLYKHPWLWNKSIHPEDQQRVDRAVADFGAGKEMNVEYRIKNSSGNWLWFNDRSIGRQQAGEEVIIEGISTNITERKQAEEIIRESEARFRSIFDNNADAVFLTAPDGGIIAANPAACRMFGYTEAEFLQYGRNAVVDTSDPATSAALEARKSTGKFEGELTFKSKDGSKFPGEISSVVFKDRYGNDRTSMVVRDISSRKQAEEALQRSEERYRTILEGMDDSYYEVDLAGNFTFVNDSLCRRLGHSRQDLIGMNYRSYTPEENYDDAFKTFNRVYRTGKSVRGVPSVAIARDGSLIFTERSVFPLLDEEGKVIGFRGISRDVTERRMAEENRRQLELKTQISSRLASVGEMAAGVAHEINNPLTAVTGYAQLLAERDNLPADIRSDLAAINDGARRVAGIVQRLLAFSRQTKPQRKYVDINELIESTLILRAYHLRVNNIEVVTRLYTGLLQTVVDPGQIQQVILNLIVNAETEMKLAHGKGRLTITTEKSNNTIQISVKDNGPGIKSEVIDKIFNPFFTTREVGQGTGLGLSLCYGIITEHKGKIHAESKPGKGAAFIIELPVIEEFTSPEQAKMQLEPGKAPKARILVVDDEQAVRDVVKRELTKEGHKVEVADDAADALKKIEGKKYNLILVDIKMPGMNGVELFKRIRKIDKSLADKVVFITGDIMSADTEKFLSETRVSHISKPFNAGQLKLEINRALSGEPLGQDK
jgi:PAS domain S-box-containing protein